MYSVSESARLYLRDLIKGLHEPGTGDNAGKLYFGIQNDSERQADIFWLRLPVEDEVLKPFLWRYRVLRAVRTSETAGDLIPGSYIFAVSGYCQDQKLVADTEKAFVDAVETTSHVEIIGGPDMDFDIELDRYIITWEVEVYADNTC